MIAIYGNSLSPYVRKALIVLAHKQIPHENVPVSPIKPTPEFLAISPLRKIPVLVDGDFVLPDSSVICRYLEDAYPDPPVYPADIRQRARAGWLEEYADTKLVDCIAPLLGERVFLPKLFGRPTDEANIGRILGEVLPEALDYLESVSPSTRFACGDFSIADVSIASVFVNGRYAGFEVDPGSHPNLRSWLDRVFATPVFRAQLAKDRRDYAHLLPA